MKGVSASAIISIMIIFGISAYMFNTIVLKEILKEPQLNETQKIEINSSEQAIKKTEEISKVLQDISTNIGDIEKELG